MVDHRIMSEREVKTYLKPQVFNRLVNSGIFDVAPLPYPFSTGSSKVYDKSDIDALLIRLKRGEANEEQQLIKRATKTGERHGKTNPHQIPA